MSRGQPARVPSGARNTVVSPDMVRFPVQKIYRLHLTGREECDEEVAHDGGILNVKDDPVCRSPGNMHSVDGRAGQIIDLFQVEYAALLHLIWREVLTVVTGRRTGQSVGVHH